MPKIAKFLTCPQCKGQRLLQGDEGLEACWSCNGIGVIAEYMPESKDTDTECLYPNSGHIDYCDCWNCDG